MAHGFGFELTIWQPTGDEVTAAQAMAGAAAGPLSPSAAGTAEGGEAGAGAAAAAAPRASLDLQPLFAELQMGPAAMLLAGQGTGKATAAAASGQAVRAPAACSSWLCAPGRHATVRMVVVCIVAPATCVHA